ncbi:hypothetical protein AYO49_05395 [Verrucomicrobiaceae bacterium SCGC AG-212-N21]|nr:hypothetical protein AYO49_05395 [Verrucomicrobiaceae bacterium SCGC AG-212-N21]
MRTDKMEWQQQNLEHARWRVAFFRSILESHLILPQQWRDEDWHEKEDLYRKRHMAAESELARLSALAIGVAS